MTKTWFITGTSSGFGRMITEKLLARGDNVAATLRKKDALDDLLRQYPQQLKTYALDVKNEVQTNEVAAQAVKNFGKIDVVISNAGYALSGAIEEATVEQISAQFQTNIMGSLFTIRAFLPHFRESGGGKILQLSSMGGHIAFAGMGYYQATKWAMECLIESLIAEVASFNIQACLIEPGAADTSFGNDSMQHAQAMEVYENTPVGAMRERRKNGNMPRPNDPEKIAQAMIDCADSAQMPKRLALGTDAYDKIKAALLSRLDDLEKNKEVTLSVAK